MRARSVPPTPSFRPAPPPVLARTSSTLVLSRRSSQRMTALSVCLLPAARYTCTSRARKSRVARSESARPTAVARDVSPQRVVECLSKGVRVDEGLGWRIALAPAAEDVLLLHLRERLAGFQRAADRRTRVLQHLQVLAQFCDAGNLPVPRDDPGLPLHVPQHVL